MEKPVAEERCPCCKSVEPCRCKFTEVGQRIYSDGTPSKKGGRVCYYHWKDVTDAE